MTDKQITDYSKITWQGHYFGAYTLSMTLSGLFLGMSGWYILLSLICFTLSLYVYAKNKEEIETEQMVNQHWYEEKKNVWK